MGKQTLLPKVVQNSVKDTFKVITENLDMDLWDDAAYELLFQLKKKAETERRLHGSKFLADVNSHIENEQRKHQYMVIKRPLAVC